MLHRLAFPGLASGLTLLAGAALAACSNADPAGAGGGSTSSSTGAGEEPFQARVLLKDHSGRPAVGVDVLVHDPSGATNQQTKTDATGAANVDLVVGGGVTVLYKTVRQSGTRAYEAISVVGLPKGAEVRLVVEADVPEAAQAPMHLSFTAVAPLFASAWDIVLPCRADMGPAETDIDYGGCARSSTYDVVAVLAATQKRIVLPAQAFKAGQSAPFQLDLAMAEAAPDVKVNVLTMPPHTLWLDAGLSANRPDGGRLHLQLQQSPLDFQGSTLSIARLPVATGGTFDLEVTAETTAGNQLARFRFKDAELPTSPVSWTVADIALIASVGPAAGTAARPELPWALTPGGAPVDAVRFNLVYSAADPGTSGAEKHPVSWTLYQAAHGDGTARFPEIPAAFVGWTGRSKQVVNVVAEHVDIAGTDSLLPAVTAEFDGKDASWSASSFYVGLP